MRDDEKIREATDLAMPGAPLTRQQLINGMAFIDTLLAQDDPRYVDHGEWAAGCACGWRVKIGGSWDAVRELNRHTCRLVPERRTISPGATFFEPPAAPPAKEPR